jgi:3-hydroxybutyryl-CoA dehydrogenase
MHSVLGDPRYRPSPWLARRAQLGLSLTQPDAADTGAPHSQESSQ